MLETDYEIIYTRYVISSWPPTPKKPQKGWLYVPHFGEKLIKALTGQLPVSLKNLS